MANHRKKPIDPSKVLPNPKHEIIARELANGSSQVDAYKKAYPKASQLTAQANACQVISAMGINDRALKLLESVGLTEGKLASRLNNHVDSDDENISLSATKEGFKLLGYGQERKESEASYNPVQIIIKQMNVNTQPTQPKADSASDE